MVDVKGHIGFALIYSLQGVWYRKGCQKLWEWILCIKIKKTVSVKVLNIFFWSACTWVLLQRKLKINTKNNISINVIINV